jgi:hypothetical protein
MSRKDAASYELGTSDETSAMEVPISKAEGKAYGAAVLYMTKLEAQSSGEKQAGDYIVGFAVEEAEGLYKMKNGKLEWEQPQDENAHIEIVVRNAEDGRFLPGLKVAAMLIDQHGAELGTQPMPFLWHPWLYHYGRNWKVPADGTYRLRVHIDAPDFPRHDRVNGKRFELPVDVEFPVVEIRTGQKISKTG